jgi:hypothetical protein
MEDDVFDEKTTDRMGLVLIGISHLSNIKRHISQGN